MNLVENKFSEIHKEMVRELNKELREYEIAIADYLDNPIGKKDPRPVLGEWLKSMGMN